MPPRVAVIAALPREVAPLAASFVKKSGIQSPNGHPLYERGNVGLVCSGVGARHAAQTARWIVAETQPELMISVGFAGALTPKLNVGDVLTPGRVIDHGSGEVFRCSSNEVVLVSCGAVLNGPEKQAMAAKYGAHVVDMEAAAMARVARQQGTQFLAVKSISDEIDFSMPPMERFIGTKGNFETVKLLVQAAGHPSWWPALARLGKNTKLASAQLCRWLDDQMKENFQQVFAEVKCSRSG
jgi:adenosylhomocysteine nucleosidase